MKNLKVISPGYFAIGVVILIATLANFLNGTNKLYIPVDGKTLGYDLGVLLVPFLGVVFIYLGFTKKQDKKEENKS